MLISERKTKNKAEKQRIKDIVDLNEIKLILEECDTIDDFIEWCLNGWDLLAIVDLDYLEEVVNTLKQKGWE